MSYLDPHDPEWPAVNLIDGLIAKPTTPTKTQLEDQTTVVLAWLLDQWPAFARTFVARCMGDAADVLDSASVIRARTWISLPKLACSPGGGVMRPDLALAGDGRSFELIIENKVGATPHHYECLSGCHPPQIPQQEAYALAWEECPPTQEARVRRVSVLSRDPVPKVEPAALRGRDLLWTDVRAMLAKAVEDPNLDRGLMTVATDFGAVLDEKVIPQPKPVTIGKGAVDPARHPVLIWGAEVLGALLPVLAEAVEGRDSGPLLNGNSFYAGGYLRFPAKEAPELSLWFWVTESGRPYSVEGYPAGLWVGRDGSWPTSSLAVLTSAGFLPLKDNAGYSSQRWFRKAEELQAHGTAADAAVLLAGELQPLLARLAGTS
jgi:hypothetical protein